jgi:hypothetical protein
MEEEREGPMLQHIVSSEANMNSVQRDNPSRFPVSSLPALLKSPPPLLASPPLPLPSPSPAPLPEERTRLHCEELH